MKGSIKKLKLLQQETPEIKDDAEAKEVAQSIAEDAEDLVDVITEQGVEEAIEMLEDMQIAVTALITHMQGKE